MAAQIQKLKNKLAEYQKHHMRYYDTLPTDYLATPAEFEQFKIMLEDRIGPDFAFVSANKFFLKTDEGLIIVSVMKEGKVG